MHLDPAAAAASVAVALPLSFVADMGLRVATTVLSALLTSLIVGTIQAWLQRRADRGNVAPPASKENPS